MAPENPFMRKYLSRNTTAVDTPPAANLLRLGLLTLWSELFTLVAFTLVTVALATCAIVIGYSLGVIATIVLPSVVVYPALVVLMSVVGHELQPTEQGRWQFVWQQVHANAVTAIILGLFLHGSVSSYFVTTSILRAHASPFGGLIWIVWFAQSLFLAMLLILLVYAFPLLVLHPMKLRSALRNSLVLATSAPLASVGMVGLMVILGASVALVGFGMWLIVPAIGAVFLVVNCHLQVEHYRTRLYPHRVLSKDPR